MKHFVAVGISLPPHTLAQIEQLATVHRKSRADYIRVLIDTALHHAQRGVAPDVKRLLTLQEHQTLLLDALCRKLLPDQPERLARAALDAVKTHHGA